MTERQEIESKREPVAGRSDDITTFTPAHFRHRQRAANRRYISRSTARIVEAAQGSANEDMRAVIRSVRNCFNESLIETMCETRWDVDIEDLTDDFLMTKILGITASFKNRELPDMDDLFSDEVTAYFHLANEIIKRNGVTDLFAEGERLKRKCKILVKFLPGPLSTKVKNELENRSGETKASVRKLYRVVSNRALDLEKESRALRRTIGKSVKSGKLFSAKGSTKVSSKKSASIVSMATGPSP
ncbi:Hypothetical protein PHPALM_8874 [Phytophthora palmivora]|uniref:Uncharacterized protein n=1 Tax=Phytophthora palmivora TaxID=4796 RepID=A0A2P4Y8S9_9STRA|nr:Hypothetical protein PHPALM_8874 [Phytophthora palmivora]